MTSPVVAEIEAKPRVIILTHDLGDGFQLATVTRWRPDAKAEVLAACCWRAWTVTKRETP